jgi:hypothetical protein
VATTPQGPTPSPLRLGRAGRRGSCGISRGARAGKRRVHLLWYAGYQSWEGLALGPAGLAASSTHELESWRPEPACPSSLALAVRAGRSTAEPGARGGHA